MAAAAAEKVRPLRRVEYDKLVALGVFEGERIELIDGVLLQMSPIGPPHCETVDRLTELFVLTFVGRARVRIQGSFAAGDVSEPEPDLSLLPLGDYGAEHPQQAYLVIEVAESSLNFDRGRKARLYAECGIPEYWVVNLANHTVEVHRVPNAGQYEQVRVFAKGSRLGLVSFPDVELNVDDFVP
ncbi:MAG TPA: Uma2 family endonuclease [Polyangiaceae bacterium]|nr:Uma2 family endonuclease [Polyangiaceae bacterium]